MPPEDQAARARRTSSLLLLAALVFGALLLRLALERPARWRNLDEGLWAGTAAFVNAGPETFADGLEPTGSRPLHFLLYVVADGVFGHYAMRGVAALNAVVLALTAWWLAGLTRELLGVKRPALLGLMGGSYLLLSAVLYEGENANSEHVGNLFLVACFHAWVVGARRGQLGWRLLACFLLGLAVTVKTQVGTLVLWIPSAWWLMRPDGARPGRAGARAFLGEMLGSGACFLLAFGVALGCAGGELAGAISLGKIPYVFDNPTASWSQRWSTTHERLFLHLVPVPAMLVAAVAGATALLSPLLVPLDEERRRALLPLRLGAVAYFLCLAGTLPGFHLYSHYFLFALPPALLVCAATLQLAVESARVPPRILAAAVTFQLVLCGPAHYGALGRRNDPAELAAAAWIRDHTRADERIFVWGSNPLLYLFARRVPASRYTALWYVVNDFEVPALPPWEPRCLERLLGDLERHPPALFVLPPGQAFGYDPARYRLERFPEVVRRLREEYEPPVVVAGYQYWRRRAG